MRKCCGRDWTRRGFLSAAAAVASTKFLRAQSEAPSSPVAIARCDVYDARIFDAFTVMFDQLGGLGRLVKNKTVAIKLNLTGTPELRLNGASAEFAQWVHWGVIGTVVYMMGEAGARRVRLLEGGSDTGGPLEALMVRAGWDPSYLKNAAPNVEIENINTLGSSKRYARFTVPYGGYLFPAFDLNQSFEDCDVFVSLAKLKQHVRAGITLSMKNCFGSLPLSIYGSQAGQQEPNEAPRGYRSEVMHVGQRAPSFSAPQELDASTPRDPGFRLPRVITDICAARPIDLAIIDGIETMAGGEGPWTTGLSLVRPRVLLAGLNPVCTDAVGTIVMGHDPMARGGEGTFRAADNMLELAETAGLGTRDPKRIEVLGEPLESVICPFGPQGAPTAT